MTAPGFSDAEIHELGEYLRRELLTVEGVADVALDGLPEERIFVEPDKALIKNLGISPGAIAQAISNSNAVSDAGSVSQSGQEIRIDAPEGSGTVDDIRGLTIGVQGEVIEITDFARVYRERVADPSTIIRFDGEEAFTLGVSYRQGENIVDVGRAVDAQLDALQPDIPLGVERIRSTSSMSWSMRPRRASSSTLPCPSASWCWCSRSSWAGDLPWWLDRHCF